MATCGSKNHYFVGDGYKTVSFYYQTM
jgi:hypothetical protein